MADVPQMQGEELADHSEGHQDYHQDSGVDDAPMAIEVLTILSIHIER